MIRTAPKNSRRSYKKKVYSGTMICFVPHHVNNSSHLICWDFLTITEYWPLPMFSGIWYNARSRSWIILSCSLSSYLGYYFTCGVIIGLFLCASLNVHLLNFMCKFFALSASLTGFFCTSWQLVLLLTNLNNLMPSAIFGSSQLTSFSRSHINLLNCTDPQELLWWFLSAARTMHFLLP